MSIAWASSQVGVKDGRVWDVTDTAQVEQPTELI